MYDCMNFKITQLLKFLIIILSVSPNWGWSDRREGPESPNFYMDMGSIKEVSIEDIKYGYEFAAQIMAEDIDGIKHPNSDLTKLNALIGKTFTAELTSNPEILRRRKYANVLLVWEKHVQAQVNEQYLTVQCACEIKYKCNVLALDSKLKFSCDPKRERTRIWGDGDFCKLDDDVDLGGFDPCKASKNRYIR
jgi:hypothetical protein